MTIQSKYIKNSYNLKKIIGGTLFWEILRKIVNMFLNKKNSIKFNLYMNQNIITILHSCILSYYSVKFFIWIRFSIIALIKSFIVFLVFCPILFLSIIAEVN